MKNLPAMHNPQEMQFPSLGWEDPLEEEMATCSSILAGESHGQRSLEGYSPRGPKELDRIEHPCTHTLGCGLCVKKAERQRIDALELWCWRRLLRVPWTAKRSNQSILKEISPGRSLEGLMLKLQYFGHLM